MEINIHITTAGRQELINAQNTGTNPVVLTEFGLGLGKYTPDEPNNQTALVDEFKRVQAVAGDNVDAATIHLTISDSSSDAYTASEFGIYTNSGTLFAVCAAPADFISKVANQAFMMSIDITLTSLSTQMIEFNTASFSNPQAREDLFGVMKIATTEQAQEGDNDLTAMTPLKTKQAIDENNPLNQTHKTLLVDQVVAAIQKL